MVSWERSPNILVAKTQQSLSVDMLVLLLYTRIGGACRLRGWFLSFFNKKENGGTVHVCLFIMCFTRLQSPSSSRAREPVYERETFVTIKQVTWLTRCEHAAHFASFCYHRFRWGAAEGFFSSNWIGGEKSALIRRICCCRWFCCCHLWCCYRWFCCCRFRCLFFAVVVVDFIVVVFAAVIVVLAVVIFVFFCRCSRFCCCCRDFCFCCRLFSVFVVIVFVVVPLSVLLAWWPYFISPFCYPHIPPFFYITGVSSLRRLRDWPAVLDLIS